MTAILAEPRTGRSLVAPALFDRLTGRIVAEEGIAPPRAEQIMDQALAFLGACATTAQPLSPSDEVDTGWHAFILHTRDYAKFCTAVAGRFIHHVPTDADDPAAHGREARKRLVRTRRPSRTLDSWWTTSCGPR